MKASQFLHKLLSLEKSQLEKIKGLGPILIDNFEKFLNSSRYHNLIKGMETLENSNKGLDILVDSVNKNDLILSGQIICITGSFDIPRNIIKELLEAKGAEVTNTVSKNTTLLLAGSDAGSKLEKAKQQGIKIENDLKILG